MDWDNYFMSMVFFIAQKSKDTSTKIGSVIVGQDNEIISTGYNGLARGVDDTKPERYLRPEKYFWFEHSERNSLYNAARIGVSTKGCRLYTNGIPCADCCRGVIQSGIKEIIVYGPWDRGNSAKWLESIRYSKEMLQETNIPIRYYEGSLTLGITGLRSEKEFDLNG